MEFQLKMQEKLANDRYFYTVGNYDNLEEIKKGTVSKLGRDDLNSLDWRSEEEKESFKNYSGGIVFRSIEEAQKYIDSTNFIEARIFGLDTSANNIYLHEDGNEYLIKSCKIIYLQ